MTHRFDTLDALRGLAALLILAMHASALLGGWLVSAHMAVPFFFVLSGFVVAHAYEPRLATHLSFAGFAKVRLIRLWPLYALGTVMGVLLFLDAIAWKRAFYVSLALAPFVLPAAHTRLSADHGSQFPFNPPAWSLFLELLANAVYALILPWLKRGLLIAILALSAAGLVAVELVSSFEHAPDAEGLGSGLAQAAYGFFAGVAAYRLWRAKPPRWSLPLFAATPVLVLAASFRLDLFWCLIGFPALVYLTAGSTLTGVVQRASQTLGSASYAIYILQWPMLVAATKAGLDRDDPWRLLLIPAIVAVGVAADRWFDRPVRRWLARMLQPFGARPRRLAVGPAE